MIDLDALRSVHPSLPEGLPEALATCAAIALQRRHEPGVAMRVRLDARDLTEEVRWRRRPAADFTMVDTNRATEDGAECVALALVAGHRPWRLVRRLQSALGEGADWLVEDRETRRQIVLEVSGTDAGPFARRVRRKRAQARLAATLGSPAVCVVQFLDPKVLLEG